MYDVFVYREPLFVITFLTREIHEQPISRREYDGFKGCGMQLVRRFAFENECVSLRAVFFEI